MKKEDVLTERSNTGTLAFCKQLHADTSGGAGPVCGLEDQEEKRRLPRRKPDHLAALTAEKEVRFGEGRRFL